MIDERLAIYTWSAYLWGGWAAALGVAALMFPHQLLILQRPKKTVTHE